MPKRVVIRLAASADEVSFLKAVKRSRKLHGRWVQPPATPRAFRRLVSLRQKDSRFVTFLIWAVPSGELVGAANISEIVRGSFLSGYLGYYAFEPHAGQGLMREGLSQVISRAFTTLKMHRVEANIQPGNTRSKQLAKTLGFKCEGFSPRYLKVNGRWRDHERWAVLAEEWRR